MSDDPNTAAELDVDEDTLLEDAAGAIAGSTLDDPDHLAEQLEE